MSGRFAEVAEDYDKLKLALPYLDEIQRKAAEIFVRKLKESLPSVETYKILELGCGTGDTTKQVVAAAEKFGIKIHLIAMDDEPKMIKQARKRIKSPDVYFVDEEAGQFLYGTNTGWYDGVVTGFMLHNHQQSISSWIVSGVLRCLKKEGVFVNADKISQSDPIVYLKSLDAELRALDILVEKCGDAYWAYWYRHYLDDDAIRITEADLVGFLKGKCECVSYTERYGMAAICVAIRS